MAVTVLQLHKRSSYEFKYIQDKYSINLDSRVFALSDGSTQSFNSEAWAQIITDAFTQSPSFDSKVILTQLKKCVPAFINTKYSFSNNKLIRGLEEEKQKKGGTATLIGIKIKSNTSFNCITCGDSNIFIKTPKGSINPYPSKTLDELDVSNQFINTDDLLNDKISNDSLNISRVRIPQDSTIIMATDALSRFFIKYPDKVDEFLNIRDFSGLLEFCKSNWDKKELEEDDISAIIIPIYSINKVNIIKPPVGFSFPREKKPERDLSKLEINPMEIRRLYEQLDRLNNNFEHLHYKLLTTKKVAVILAVIILLNISLVSFLVADRLFINKLTATTEIATIPNTKIGSLILPDSVVQFSDSLNTQLSESDSLSLDSYYIDRIPK